MMEKQQTHGASDDCNETDTRHMPMTTKVTFHTVMQETTRKKNVTSVVQFTDSNAKVHTASVQIGSKDSTQTFEVMSHCLMKHI